MSVADNVQLFSESIIDAVALNLLETVKEVIPNVRLHIEHSFGLDESPNFVGMKFFLINDAFGTAPPTKDDNGDYVDLYVPTGDELATITEKFNQNVTNDLEVSVEADKDIQDAITELTSAGSETAAALVRSTTLKKVTLVKLGSSVSVLSGGLPILKSLGKIGSTLGKLEVIPPATPTGALTLRRVDTEAQLEGFSKVGTSLSAVLALRAKHGVYSLSEVNQKALEGEAQTVVDLGEKGHKAQIKHIAAQIIAKGSRLVLVGGPSASGKTTFTELLSAEVERQGTPSKMLSFDNYYKSRDDPTHPKDAEGNLDFESAEALRIDLISKHISQLLAGETIKVPEFDFKAGQPIEDHTEVSIVPGAVIFVEGIHGLNPRMDDCLDAQWLDKKTLVFIAPLGAPRLTDSALLTQATTRLLRRTLRDMKDRGYTPADTLARWPAVRRGEEASIMPFVHRADFVFDSSHPAELGIVTTVSAKVMAEYVQTLTAQIEALQTNQPAVVQTTTTATKALAAMTLDKAIMLKDLANQLLAILSYAQPIPSKLVPEDALLREFIGKEPKEEAPVEEEKKADTGCRCM